MLEIWYLYHSGFAVKTAGHLLVFDYYVDKPRGCGLHKGVIDPAEIKDLDVVVLSSHRHEDHYNPRIFTWRKTIPQIRYVLADTIKTTEEVYQVRPGQMLALPDITVRALDSTDEGVAFLVKVDGHTIYHAGDLNWWHWEGEQPAINEAMGRKYREQIDLLKGEKIDLAFVPVDPRLGDSYLLGLDYYMTQVDARLAVPMHFGDDHTIFQRLEQDPQTAAYRERVAKLERRGQKLVLEDRR